MAQPSSVTTKSAQMSYLSRFAKENDGPKSSDAVPPPPTAPTAAPSETSVTLEDQVMRQLTTLSNAQCRRAEAGLSLLLKKATVDPADRNLEIFLNGNPTGVPVVSFLWNLQQPTKKLSAVELNLVGALNLPEHLVSNKDGKNKIVQKTSSGSDPQGGKQGDSASTKRQWTAI